jgi:hypothetical protein
MHGRPRATWAALSGFKRAVIKLLAFMSLQHGLAKCERVGGDRVAHRL